MLRLSWFDSVRNEEALRRVNQQTDERNKKAATRLPRPFNKRREDRILVPCRNDRKGRSERQAQRKVF